MERKALAVDDKPSAFVIMPFDKAFDSVYGSFIRPLLKNAGFKVHRADDIDSQQNILKVIVESIVKSDLIVADLTDANPNVFYEVGLAHALEKKVILITQSIDEIPFDLKPYKSLEYSTHFDEIEHAKKRLTDYAKGYLNGSLQFGTPVTDFYQRDATGSQHEDTDQIRSVTEDDRGLIDHQIALISGYENLATLITDATTDLDDLTKSLNIAAEDFNNITANSSASSPKAAQRVARRLAERINHFTNNLNRTNVEYSSIALDTEDSLEFVVSFQFSQSDIADPKFGEQISSQRRFVTIANGTRDNLLDLATQMDTLPRLERRLNRGVAGASEEIRVMASNIDKTIASVTRAINKYDDIPDSDNSVDSS